MDAAVATWRHLLPKREGDPRMWGGPQGGYCRIIYLGNYIRVVHEFDVTN